ncbi:hypothetical protein NET03_08490 [Thermomicrobium sp. CFH 73360]|uniref:DinB/UmuC family translesion DNA polymerase n=1 Tax=Thermomicrobium sp. CFH 73360 TaxID=2951987 RepID=UPI002077747D|nr:hypothetical protein [Thermomicrobium sp. CFH 73360]MCM8746573.1 hypothetical protein [Thermomicrobium sp. CFH 73360]
MRVGYLWLDRLPSVSLAEVLTPLTPAVQLDEERTGVWFEASGVRLLYGDEQRYGQAVLAALAAAGGAGRLGIAATPWIARVAARLAATGEVTVVPIGEARAFLRPLPLEWLPLPRQVLARLRALGVSTIGQFADLPPGSIQRRFGTEALTAHRIARGDDPIPFRGQVPVEPLRFERTLEPPAVTSDALALTLHALAAQAMEALNRLGHVAWRLQLELVAEDGRSTSRRRHFPYPLRTAEELAESARALALRCVLPGAVTLLRLVIDAHGTVTAHQPGLLVEAPSRRKERERVFTLAQRLVPGHVVRVVEHCPVAPLPEQRWRLEGLANEEAHPARGEPVRLIRRAQNWWLDVAGQRLRVVRSGPWERIDLWWPERQHRRTGWVELADGQRLLLSWDARDDQWRLVSRLD